MFKAQYGPYIVEVNYRFNYISITREDTGKEIVFCQGDEASDLAHAIDDADEACAVNIISDYDYTV